MPDPMMVLVRLMKDDANVAVRVLGRGGGVDCISSPSWMFPSPHFTAAPPALPMVRQDVSARGLCLWVPG